MNIFEQHSPSIERTHITLEDGDKERYGLSGDELRDAMSAYNKSDKSGLRPNSEKFLLEEKRRVFQIQQEKEARARMKQEKEEADEKARFIPTNSQVIITAPHVVGAITIEEPIKNTKHVPVKNIFEEPEKVFLLKKMLSSVYAHRPNPQDFVGAMQGTPFEKKYSKNAIARDIKRREINQTMMDMDSGQFGKSFKEKNESNFLHGEMLQLIIIDRMNAGWIPDMKAIMTCDVDDHSAGIDAAVQYKKTAYFGMSFDMTISENKEFVEKKIQKNWDFYISKGFIPYIKYYQDPEDPSIKGMRSMPKFIIGGSREDLERLSNAYVTDRLDSIEHDPLLYTIIAQIEIQLQKILTFYELHDHAPQGTIHSSYLEYSRFARFFEKIKASIDFDNQKNNTTIQKHLQENTLYKIVKEYTPIINK
ncbi:MAG: hypothetical protein KBB88_00755 [Candidatus Pacebacteria bacterium]|nr:hypothetical protein [Candidatus Paceibacterota bacterium]